MGIDRSRDLPASAGGESPHSWSDTASHIWSSATTFVHDHPVVATSIAVVGTAGALAALKGRAGVVLDASAGGRVGLEAAGAESLLANSKAVFAGSDSMLARTESSLASGLGEKIVARNVGGELSPVWISGPEKIISPSGIQIITADLSSLGAGGVVDAFPQIPKMVVSDPLFRAGGLVTNFEGNLPSLYEAASSNVVRLQVTRTEGAATYAKTGSGYFNPQGEIVTAHHVISGGHEINVFGKPFEQPLRAIVQSVDPEHDLAVLKLIDPPASILKNIRPFNYRPASELLQPSEQVIGFGYPNGAHTLTAMPGNFSNWKNIQLGVNPEMTGDAMRTFMETAPGASGGAMVDANGRLFGTIVQMNKGDHVGWSVPYSAARGF